MSSDKEYILKTNQTELDRLEFQHGVWKKVTDNMLNKINIQPGWKCLDVGSGPGFVSMELLNHVGEKGEVTALEPSEFYLNHFKEYCTGNSLKNVNFINGTVENTDLKHDQYDLIFMRWVIDFVPEPEKFLLKLLDSLKKGGVIAIQDYNYEGIGLYPKGGAFDNVAEVVRAYYRAGGGDPYFISKIPPIFKRNNIQLLDYTPLGLAGDNQSGVFLWVGKFFTGHLQTLADLKIISADEKIAYEKDWKEYESNPDAVCFSPIVVDVIGKKL